LQRDIVLSTRPSKSAAVCPNCGTENPSGFRFCGICGVNLLTAKMQQATAQELQRLQSYIPSHLVEEIVQEARVGRGERCNMTILFADLSGFTALSEKLDPEEVYRLLDGCPGPLLHLPAAERSGAADSAVGRRKKLPRLPEDTNGTVFP